jgi:C4-dicarboxylate transporter, DctQ subunit
MKFFDRLEEWLIAALMAIATLIIFVSVVHRYASGIALLQDFALAIDMSWAQELCIYLFVWMAKFGAAYGVRTGIHVGVDVLINRLNERNRRLFIYFGLFAGALFTAIVGALGAKLVHGIYATGQVSADMELPMWLVYLAIPLGSFLMCFRFLQVAWNFHHSGELPRHEVAHVEGLESEIR